MRTKLYRLADTVVSINPSGTADKQTVATLHSKGAPRAGVDELYSLLRVATHLLHIPRCAAPHSRYRGAPSIWTTDSSSSDRPATQAACQARLAAALNGARRAGSMAQEASRTGPRDVSTVVVTVLRLPPAVATGSTARNRIAVPSPCPRSPSVHLHADWRPIPLARERKHRRTGSAQWGTSFMWHRHAF